MNAAQKIQYGFRIACTVFFICIVQSFSYSASNKTETKNVSREKIDIPFVKIPENFGAAGKKCFSKKSEEFIEEVLLFQEISEKKIPELALESGIYVLNFLQNPPKDLEEVYKNTKTQREKIFRECFPDVFKNTRENYGIAAQKWKKKFQTIYQQNLSIGTVQTIKTNGNLVLKNGAEIKIEDIAFPQKISKTHSCFRHYSQKFLKQTLQENAFKVLLTKPQHKKDVVQKVFLRNVFIPRKKTKLGAPKNLAEILIKNGFAKHVPSEKRKKFTEESRKREFQKNAYQKKLGAWGKCLPFLKNDSQKNPEKIQTESCPVKGNITGSKKVPIKKYHTKASPWYNRTIAEKCFSSETQALQEGFIKVQ